jgi:maltooligosyltrehalose trehalohydrolase
VLTGERTGYYADFGSFRLLARALENGYVYDGRYSLFRGRRHGRRLDKALKSRLFGYLQNHDQIGNRAHGDRISARIGIERLKIGAALVLLGPFIPMLFQGEEWAASTPFQYFTNHSDPELGRAVTEGRRRESARFGWAAGDMPDPQDPETFRRSKLDWGEVEHAPHTELLRWHRQLIRFRKQHPALRSPEASAAFDESEGLFIMERPGIPVVCNLSAAPRAVRRRGRQHLRLQSSDRTAYMDHELVLAPESVAVLAGRPSREEANAADEEESIPAAL